MCVHLITAQLLRIFNLPFNNAQSESELEHLTKELNQSEIISCCIGAVKYLQKEHIGIAISLLSRLILNNEDDKQFASQFVAHNGLLLIQKNQLLILENPISLIIDTLNILS